MAASLANVLLTCALVELALLGLFGALTHALPAALVCSVAVGGPASLWLAPALRRRWRQPRPAQRG